LRTADVAVDLYLPENVKVALPGDNLTFKMRLSVPMPMGPGQRFALREGGKTVAAGIVSKFLEEKDVIDYYLYKK